MKKGLSLLLSICFVLLFFMSTSFNTTVSAETSGYYTYTVSSGKATITDVSSSLKNSVEIPATLGEYPVTGIGVSAFYNAYRMTSVTIPASVQNIDSSAFTYCYNLTSISVDENNQFFSSFGGVLFNKNKTKLLKCPPGRYSSTYEVPEGVTTIEEDAFSRCTHIYSIVMPGGVTNIGKFAFYNCQYLESVFLPESVNEIDSYAFGYFTSNYESFEPKRSLTVYYQGSQHKTPQINTQGNARLLECTWKYNQCNVNEKHIYSDDYDINCNICNFLRQEWTHTYNTNDNHTCGVCGYSKAPNAPIVEKVTNNSVYLKAYSYLEYSQDGVNWQNENVFEGLSSETEYIFYQRVKPTDDAVSESSLGTELTTKKLFYINFDANGGTDAPETQEKVEDIPMTISSQTPTRSGYVFAGWGSLKKCGKQYASGEEYTIDEDLTLYALWYAFDECDTCLGVGTIEKCNLCSGRGYYYNKMCLVCGSYATTIQKEQQHTLFFKCNVCDAECATRVIECQWCDGTGKYLHDCGNCGGIGGNIIKQDAPVIVSYTDTTVTLMSKDGYEYSNDGVNWQESNVFTNLSAGTKYTFYQRIGATDTVPFSPMSLGVDVTTDKSKQTLIPNAPTVQSFTANSITLNAVDGCEYSKNGTIWQSSNVFSGLSCGTEYTFYQRYKETTTTYAGKSSEALVAKTDKGTQSKPSSPTLSSKTYNSVILTAISGYEYSRDGVNWQTSNVFTALRSDTNYMFYQRKAETETHYASVASVAYTVKTSEEPLCVTNPQLHSYDNNCDTICNECGVTRAITHDYAAATCDAPKTCKVCGATSGSKLSHKSDSGTVTKKATCTATGTKTYKCTLCKATIKTDTIAKVAHKYDSGKATKAATCKAAGVKTYTCSVCKGTKTETIAKLTTHTYSNNCDKSCNVCGKTRTVGAHKYSNACDTTCNYCNAKRTIKHTYSNSCDTSCNVCKATRTITHTYKTTTTKATLSKNGSVVKKCTVCGKVASNTAIKYAKTFKLSTTSYTYNGKVKTPSVTVKDSAGNTLKKNTDYTVTYASGRKNAGTYKVTIKMKGNYTGTKTLTFKIKPAKLSSFKLSDTSYTYNGKTKTPSVTVKNANGTKMTKNKHYTVTYSSGRKNVGTYEVTIKGKGNYTGTKTLTFKINPAKTTVSKLTAGKKKITVAITKKSTQVTGYQIQYSTSKKFTNAKTKTISSYKTTKYTLKSLSAKKTYYVRVRTYKTVGKTKYYSGWSTYKYVKTK